VVVSPCYQIRHPTPSYDRDISSQINFRKKNTEQNYINTKQLIFSETTLYYILFVICFFVTQLLFIKVKFTLVSIPYSF
jgi:hypothetical protein